MKTKLPDSDQTRHHICSQCGSQFLSASRTTHLEGIMKILRYLKKALEREHLHSDRRHTRVAGFSDADWAGYPFDMKSII